MDHGHLNLRDAGRYLSRRSAKKASCSWQNNRRPSVIQKQQAKHFVPIVNMGTKHLKNLVVPTRVQYRDGWKLPEHEKVSSGLRGSYGRAKPNNGQ